MVPEALKHLMLAYAYVSVDLRVAIFESFTSAVLLENSLEYVSLRSSAGVMPLSVPCFCICTCTRMSGWLRLCGCSGWECDRGAVWCSRRWTCTGSCCRTRDGRPSSRPFKPSKSRYIEVSLARAHTLCLSYGYFYLFERLKVAYMLLVNTMVTHCPGGVRERNLIRDRFLPRDILDLIKVTATSSVVSCCDTGPDASPGGQRG